MKAGDTHPPITMPLTMNGEPWSIPDGAVIRLWMKTTLEPGTMLKDGTIITERTDLHVHTGEVDVEDQQGGIITYTPAPADTNQAPFSRQLYLLEAEVDQGTDDKDRPLITTFPHDSYEELEVLPGLDPPDEGSGSGSGA